MITEDYNLQIDIIWGSNTQTCVRQNLKSIHFEFLAEEEKKIPNILDIKITPQGNTNLFGI